MNNTIKLVENGGIVPSPFERFVTEGIGDWFSRKAEAPETPETPEETTPTFNDVLSQIGQVMSAIENLRPIVNQAEREYQRFIESGSKDQFKERTLRTKMMMARAEENKLYNRLEELSKQKFTYSSGPTLNKLFK